MRRNPPRRPGHWRRAHRRWPARSSAQNLGLNVVLIDKGCLTNSLFHYPAHMTFFTTPELLEIGNMPFQLAQPEAHARRSAGVLPQGRRALQAGRAPVSRTSTASPELTATSPCIQPTSSRRKLEHRARKIIVSTGYYDLPNYLNLPGEDLPKVKHYYHEPHPYFAQDVLVIGGKNSAAIAALDLWRHGARVTLVHRGEALHRHIKYWIKPDIENRIKNHEITAHLNTVVTRIDEDSVTLATAPMKNGQPAMFETVNERTIPNQFVFALTGYHPDFSFIESLGVQLDAGNALPGLQPRHGSSRTWQASTSRASSLPASAPTKSSSRTAASTAP